MDTEFFRHDLRPIAAPVAEFRSYLLIAPHQDDETIGAGGTLLLATAAKARIDIVYVTDGAVLTGPHAGPAGVRLRDEEAVEACGQLGATIHRLDLSNPSPAPSATDVDRLAALIEELAPEVIMVPWLLDVPPKHRLANHLLWLANQRRPLSPCEVWSYQTHNTLYPNAYVDITSVAEEKRRILKCFRSQKEHHHLALGMAAWNARHLPNTGGAPSYAEVFFTLPLDEHLRLVEKFYFPDLDATYKGDRNVLDGARAVHDEIVTGS